MANRYTLRSTDAALAAAESAADFRAALSTRVSLPDTGWTDDTSGTATVTHAAGVHTLAVGVSEGAETIRPSPADPACPAIEIRARLDLPGGAPASVWWGAIELRSEDGADALIAQVTESGGVDAWLASAGSSTRVRTGGPGEVSLTSGEDWLRLSVTPAVCSVAHGTGVGGAPPTSWTHAHSEEIPAALVGRGRLAWVGLRVGRDGSGSGSVAVEWRDLSVRLLGLAP